MKTQVTRITLSLIILIFTSENLISQEEHNVTGLIKTKITMMSNPTKGIHTEINISDEQLKAADANELLTLLSMYEQDTSLIVRRAAFWYELRLSQAQPVPAIRRQVTTRLFDGLLSGNCNQAGNWLLAFKAEDFTNETREKIREILTNDRPSISVIKVCGIANIRDQMERLEEFLIDEEQYTIKAEKGAKLWYLTRGWSARLARARMGVKEDITRCINMAESEKNTDQRVLHILPQIGYIRQPEVIEYLKKYLDSDLRLPPTNPDMEGGPVASRIVDILTDCIKDFPVKKKLSKGYTQKEIETARKWMNNKANWKIIR